MNKISKGLASLKLTLFSLTGLFIVVFVSTLAQVDMGIYLAKKTFFEGVFIYWNPINNIHIPVFPTGYTFGVLLCINLIYAHILWFKLSWKKIGIWLIHSGLLILIVGSGLVASLAVESQVALEEGETKWYTQSTNLVELAISTDESDTQDRVVAVPFSTLKASSTLTSEPLPFRIQVRARFENSNLTMRSNEQSALVSQGVGQKMAIQPLEPRYDPNYRNMKTLILELYHQDTSLGTWLLSTGLGVDQEVIVDGATYRLRLRPKRYYHGFGLTLLDFKHDKYAGTDIPKNFSSKVSVFNPESSSSQEALIYMNHPLRYKGLTFYQASYGKNDTLSVFQVVKNPGRLLPYLSSVLMSLGLLIHFMIHLLTFLHRSREKARSLS